MADGFGMLENLAFDGRGKMLLSEGTLFGDGAIRTLTPAGKTGTLVSDFTGPGGIVLSGDNILFTTGNTAMAGLSNSKNGTVESVNLDTGEKTTVAKGLTMPNGLARLANGDLLVTRNLGSDQGLTRIPAAQPRTPASVRTDLGSANGLAVSADGATVYVGNTFDSNTEIRELNATDLKGSVRTVKVAGSGATNAGDDLTVGADGNVYMALNGAGKVVRVDPATGSTCEIGSGLPLTSSVRFGSGPGWDPAALYTTSFDGSVHKLTPPKK
ncbi:SMP-30/gluconolactonase/LRE family protein [Rhodococcus sp. UNC363MFTsu5.1]|uniref:SMP-30/gluconolactonase/LRE family protein n=1 Tax=Rhodococcus sp. UNC363MFTsu5.1 TaxID=1449069 RepID=UPI001E2ACB37|nr:SMP-30/gluconolactonase/LRE family protein [Rhodococcus sp. UNC363MFTsu5.1]